MPEGDVSIYVDMSPTESSIRSMASRLNDQVNKMLGKGSIYGPSNTLYSQGKGDSGETNSLLKEIIKGVAIGNLIASTFYDFLKPIFAILKAILVLLFLPLIPLLVPILRLLKPFLEKSAEVTKGIFAAEKKGGAEGAATTVGVGAGAAVGGAAGFVLGGPIGAMLGAVLGTSIGGAVAQAAVDFGKNLGKGLLAIVDSLVAFGGDLGQAIINAIVAWQVFLALLGNKIENVLGWISDNVFNNPIWEKIGKTVSYIFSTVFGTVWNQINAVILFIKNTIFGTVWDTISLVIKGIAAALKAGLDAINSASKAVTKLIPAPVKTALGIKDDFIYRPGQGIASFSPSDTVIGVKDTSKLGGGSVNVYNTFQIDAGVDASRLKSILEEFSRQQARDLRLKTGYSAGLIA